MLRVLVEGRKTHTNSAKAHRAMVTRTFMLAAINLSTSDEIVVQVCHKCLLPNGSMEEVHEQTGGFFFLRFQA